MSLADAERLRKIHTFPSLVKYLRDDLGWPIESDDFDELMFEYEPEELGLDPKTAVKVERIMQLRPLTTDQPFGIFFLHFQPKRLPVVVLRRILQTLAVKKRASANRPDMAAWRKNDLLFISAFGEDHQRTITFAHFREDEYQPGDLPTLRVLGWDDRDTVLHIGDVHDTLANKLSWPRNEDDVDAWREKWCSAFTLQHREVITTSKRLATRLAELARVIRKRVSAVLEVEDKREGREGPLTKLHHVFKTALIHDLSEDDFADMYAQTIAYGLLSARVSRPAGLVADNIADMVPVTNPFLKELLEEFLHVGGRKKQGKTGLDFDELGVTEVVETLRAANMEAVLRDFGDRNPQEDPVIHFYELFLKEYDAEKRMKRGVFYTPRPVVSYIVRSVHELLQTEFSLEDGLADTTTWAEMVKRFPAKEGKKGEEPKEGLKIPESTPPGQAFVQILDPATGTGTFLVEVIDVIHKTMVGKWEAQGHGAQKTAKLWNDYVPSHLLPRLHGYELMMAPYAIAHMKIGLKLYETGYRFDSDERARIYLTNALEPPQDYSGHFDFDIPALAHEAEAVNEIKRRHRFTVVIGNPPYAQMSQNLGEKERELVAPYKFCDGERIAERGAITFERNLQDDYIKFIRLAEMTINAASIGILGMITNHAFLGNITLRGVRNHLIHSFSFLDILDLHGNSKIHEIPPQGVSDENVFDIQQGVAISIFRRFFSQAAATVVHREIWGTREHKYEELSNRRKLPEPEPVVLRRPNYLLTPQDHSLAEEYEGFMPLPEVFPTFGSAITTARDSVVVGFEDSEIIERVQVFQNTTTTNDDILEQLGIRESAIWNVAKARSALQKVRPKDHITDVAYRPFDIRRLFYHDALVSSPRHPTMDHMTSPHSLALAVCRQQGVPGFRHVFCAKTRFDEGLVSNRSREKTVCFPILLQNPHEDLVDSKRCSANLSSLITEIIRGSYCVGWSDVDLALKVFQYTYSILHSNKYRSRYETLLKVDFPRIPLVSHVACFLELSALGKELIDLHLLDSPKLTTRVTIYKGSPNPEVGNVRYTSRDQTVWLEKSRRSAFQGIPEDVWDFYIGGYQVCHKWLKDRKGRTLSDDDIAHYQKIIVALNETIRIMAEIDDVIDQHGGWPDAFQTGADSDGK